MSDYLPIKPYSSKTILICSIEFCVFQFGLQWYFQKVHQKACQVCGIQF